MEPKNLQLLRRGNSEYNLIVLPGINGGNNLGDWNLEGLHFPGDIYFFNWESRCLTFEIMQSAITNRNIFDFGRALRDYIETTVKADRAGELLSEILTKSPLPNATMIGYSMGSRIAHTFIGQYEHKINQVLLFNACISREHCYEFQRKKGKVKNGIVNYFNENDPTLGVLSVFDSMFPNDGILSNIKNGMCLNEPLGVAPSSLIEKNISIYDQQGISHNIPSIISDLIQYDTCKELFITKTEN